MMRTAFYAGSFDPPTLGHIDVITRGLVLFDRLVIGIGIHATKKPLLDFETRVAMLRDSTVEIAQQYGKTLDIVSFDGLVVVAAQAAKAQFILRSLRDSGDFEYETSMTAMNHIMAPSLETVFLAARSEFDFISSTLVRQIAQMDGDVRPFVSPNVAEVLTARFQKQKS